MKKMLLRAVWLAVFAVALPVAMITGVYKGSREAMNIISWPDGVCDWLAFRLAKTEWMMILVAVIGGGLTFIATDLIWSAWHVNNPMYATLASRLGFTAGGVFIYLAGMALLLLAVRRLQKPERRRPV